MKHWQIIADRLSNHWLDLGLRVSRGFWGANDLDCRRASRRGKRYVVRAEEKVAAFLELEAAVRGCTPVSCFYVGAF
jgi:hypothetical protein